MRDRRKRDRIETENAGNELNNIGSSWRTYRRSTNGSTDKSKNKQSFKSLCALAESKRVRVFTIGFDVKGSTELTNDLRECATFDSDFYNVEGTDIAKAFESIAGQINRLKLVN